MCGAIPLFAASVIIYIKKGREYYVSSLAAVHTIVRGRRVVHYCVYLKGQPTISTYKEIATGVSAVFLSLRCQISFTPLCKTRKTSWLSPFSHTFFIRQIWFSTFKRLTHFNLAACWYVDGKIATASRQGQPSEDSTYIKLGTPPGLETRGTQSLAHAQSSWWRGCPLPKSSCLCPTLQTGL
jgi:hypothetical protein